MTERIIIPYRFRSIIDADLPMVERWLKTPEVARWWGDPAEQLVLLKEDLDDPLMRQWIVEYGQRPFAYVQAYEAHAWPQVHLQSLPGGTQVIDAFIGEPDMLGHGHGSAFLGLLAGSFIRERLGRVPSEHHEHYHSLFRLYDSVFTSPDVFRRPSVRSDTAWDVLASVRHWCL